MSVVLLFLTVVAGSPGADLILNEYNAVGGGEFLGGGSSATDEAGERASDRYFGRVPGNGGDWFELVVITDHLDIRGWQLDILDNGVLDETLDLTDHDVWSDLRSGTIITISEDVPSDVSYNPAGGDWWINVQANDDADGLFVEASSFPVSNNNWQLQIRDAAGTVVFGPAGEGVSPGGGIGGTEVFRLEADPSPAITPGSNDYDDGADLSTFGAPNRWGVQDLSALRLVELEPAPIALLFPNGQELLVAGDVVIIRWSAPDLQEDVLIEFSLDGGNSWSPVYPPNRGNLGHYRWLVPAVASEASLVRVSSAAQPAAYDISDGPFVIFQCGVEADVTGDCLVDFLDLAILASHWLDCDNPYLPICAP
jgi:hypothetical protein